MAFEISVIVFCFLLPLVLRQEVNFVTEEKRRVRFQVYSYGGEEKTWKWQVNNRRERERGERREREFENVERNGMACLLGFCIEKQLISPFALPIGASASTCKNYKRKQRGLVGSSFKLMKTFLVKVFWKPIYGKFASEFYSVLYKNN